MNEPFTPVLLAREIREIERAALAQPSTKSLMERAGLAVAEFARELMAEKEKRILLIAGPGNKAEMHLSPPAISSSGGSTSRSYLRESNQKFQRMRKPRWPSGRPPAAHCTKPYLRAGAGT
jgi:hypothetical protein